MSMTELTVEGSMKYEVRIMWRKKGQRKLRIIHADPLKQAQHIAFEKFGVNRGVRLAKQKDVTK